MTTKLLTALLLGTSILGSAGLAYAEDVTLTIESWRTDDLPIWQDKIIPAFEAKHPGHQGGVRADRRRPNTTPRSTPSSQGGTRRRHHHLPAVRRVAGAVQGGPARRPHRPAGHGELLADVAKVAWPTDDGKPTFCVPMASVIHGFIYNKDAFDKLGITRRRRPMDEFFADLDKIKADGTYIPLDMGTHDQWEAATMGYQNIGPNYWKGEDGRKALIAGTQKLTDAALGRAVRASSPSGSPISATASRRRPIRTARTCSRSAAPPSIRPARGRSPASSSQARPQDGRLPAAGRRRPATSATSPTMSTSRWASTPRAKNPDAAKTFLTWVASRRVRRRSTPTRCRASSRLTSHADRRSRIRWPRSSSPGASKCKSTIRSTYQILSRGTPNLENETWAESANVINGTDTPEAAAKKLQDGLDSWYKPAQAIVRPDADIATISAGPRYCCATRPSSA